MKILIAEDEKVSALLLEEILKNWGAVDIAYDGKEAFDFYAKAYAKQEMYDFICLDIMMPHLSGQEVLEKIREFEMGHGVGGKDMVPVIMTTALSDEKNVMKAFLKGVCEGYLVKPVTFDKMKNELLRLKIIS